MAGFASAGHDFSKQRFLVIFAMGNARRKLLLNTLKLFDLGLMILALIAAGLAVVHQSRDVTIVELFSMRVKIQNFAIIVLFFFFFF